MTVSSSVLSEPSERASHVSRTPHSGVVAGRAVSRCAPRRSWRRRSRTSTPSTSRSALRDFDIGAAPAASARISGLHRARPRLAGALVRVASIPALDVRAGRLGACRARRRWPARLHRAAAVLFAFSTARCGRTGRVRRGARAGTALLLARGAAVLDRRAASDERHARPGGWRSSRRRCSQGPAYRRCRALVSGTPPWPGLAARHSRSQTVWLTAAAVLVALALQRACGIAG